MEFENGQKTAESSLCSLLLRKQNEKLELAGKRPLKIPSTALTHSEKYVEDRIKRDTAWKNISTEKQKLLIVFYAMRIEWTRRTEQIVTDLTLGTYLNDEEKNRLNIPRLCRYFMNKLWREKTSHSQRMWLYHYYNENEIKSKLRFEIMKLLD